MHVCQWPDLAKLSPKMTTRSIYTEVLYNLGPTKNIGASLKTFGLTGQEKEILAVILDTSKSEESVVSLIKVWPLIHIFSAGFFRKRYLLTGWANQ